MLRLHIAQHTPDFATMFSPLKRFARPAWGLLLAAALLGGCTVTSTTRAPVEDRVATSQQMPSRVDPSTLPGFENAGRPGYYTVRPGDTVRRIAAEVGQPWNSIAQWNNLENPDLIEVGQVLRIVPPTAGSAAPAVAAAAPSAARAATSTAASGSVLKRFDGDTNKGLNIGGKAGDPVLAAADGKVVYAGSGLSGYGNLIILKHDNVFLTAYAHNRALLVKEDQNVRRGQKIAEMGSTGADRVNLHFEIRRSGRPVDPAKYLPAR